MNKVPSIVEFLGETSKKDKNFQWEASEDIKTHTVTIRTSRDLTNLEKIEIERLGAYYGGPAKYNFQTSNCCYKAPNEIECKCYWCTT